MAPSIRCRWLLIEREEACQRSLAAPEDIIAEIERSGLRGRGGAGFPAHIKWRTVAETQAEQKYIVCNADEGDSGTFADRLIMEGDPFRLIEGMMIAGYATGASKGIVYLRSEYPTAATIFTDALHIARAAGLIGADRAFDIDLFVGAGAYICGEETSLLESLEGKRGRDPNQTAIAGGGGSVRQTDPGAQRHHARFRALDCCQWRCSLRAARDRGLDRHDAVSAQW